jgi:hypothetical protein
MKKIIFLATILCCLLSMSSFSFADDVVRFRESTARCAAALTRGGDIVFLDNGPRLGVHFLDSRIGDPNLPDACRGGGKFFGSLNNTVFVDSKIRVVRWEVIFDEAVYRIVYDAYKMEATVFSDLDAKPLPLDRFMLLSHSLYDVTENNWNKGRVHRYHIYPKDGAVCSIER